MELLYPQEHVTCFNYDGECRSIIQILTLEKGKEYTYKTNDHKLIFVNSGKLSLYYEDLKKVEITKTKFTLVPSLSNIMYTALEECDIVIFRLKEQMKLCDRFSLEKLEGECDTKRTKNKGLTLLEVNSILKDYLKMLFNCHSHGLRCYYYSELKLKELFYLLRAYYPKGDLASLFSVMLTSDIKFSNFISQNYSKTKTVKELAEIANYSISGFEKRFKKVFGVSAGVWLNKKRAMQIYQEVNCTSKPFKAISVEFGFSSPAHFNEYCKNQFGDTPGEIRKTSRSTE